ncbi:receptor-like protein kinase 7 [Impatiens glandulifera]|uniref:receptor-like protein kinase 7 n=1 Tax=Impatiens glandulifera TaxID=253017 RepID=UPI001FB073D9|nr:receptor-like protein kinase 7 [Impatiens glandulifera]
MPPVKSSRQKHQILCLFSLFLFSPAFSDDLQPLLALKSALQNPSATVFHTWNPTTNQLCNFTGITCHPDGSVQVIELSSQYLSGEVPFNSICELKSLEKLSLGKNSLFGTVTEDLKKCVNLNYLDLGNNFFGGIVPDLSPLNQLTSLYLNNSGFSGPFPWNSLSNMSGLLVLSVGDNPFDRTPFPDVIMSLKKLNWLYLSNCSIEGSIPSGIGNLTELRSLELSDNYLDGEIPIEITKLKNLWRLELYDNSLTGKLPVGLRNLTNLEYLDASNNQLEGDLSEVSELHNLVSLQLYTNGFTGEVPPELGNFRRLVNISLYQNQLTGELPQKLGYWSEFDFIDVSENYLTGPIPPDMCRNGKMTKLLILQNKFTGGIPTTYANCLSLSRLRVSNNSLSGEVPSGIWGLPKVGMIDIALNEFVGPISDEIGKAVCLNGLRVNNNRLSGQVPTSIGNASLLVEINLSNNQLSGGIPVTIGQLHKLSTIHLENNKISGSIPPSISSCVALSDINMANNSISGEIPFSLGSLPALNSLNLTCNQLAGPIPSTLSSLKLSRLDLSHNHLSGPIPDSLSSDAYNSSFVGNNGLCSVKIAGFRHCSSDTNNLNRRNLLILVLSLAILIGFSLLSIPCYSYIKKNRFRKDLNRSLKEDSWDVKSFHVLTFTEDDILNSIKPENHIGKGGSGNVYKVSLSNGKDLAVKHILNSDAKKPKRIGNATALLTNHRSGSRRKMSEFDAEVRTLSSIRHVNVVKLYCSITNEDSSLLVYEFMPNGSLWDRLHMCAKMSLDWETRYEIALGSAKGLEYLHHSCDRPIIHRDVKSSNILLDELLKPRIADFGLAKIVQVANSNDSTQVIAGTYGYIAPEYGYTCKVDEKSDVYSFGVVLMELVTGKKPIDLEFGENKDIVDWIYGRVKSRDRESVLSIVDLTIQGYHREEALKVLRIAIECTARCPSVRPTMRSVVQMLQEAEPCKLVSIKVNKDDNKDRIGDTLDKS